MLITTSVLDQYFRQDYTICMMNKNPVNPVNLVILSLLVFVIQHTTLAQTVDKLIQREMRERRIPGLHLAVVRDGKIVLSKSFGTVTNKTVFPSTHVRKRLRVLRSCSWWKMGRLNCRRRCRGI